MSLPQIKHPLVEVTVPTLNKKLRFRPFTVEEEKIMLMANASEKDTPILATKQVINNCCADAIDVDNLSTFDIEWLFIQLRSISVSNMLDIEIESHRMQIDLNKVAICYPIEQSNRIMLSDSDKIGVVLKYPTYADLETYSESEKANLVASVIKNIFRGEEVFDLKDYSSEEIETFLNSLSISQMNKIEQWIDNIPYVYLDVNMPDGTTTRLRGIKTFFG